MCLYLPHVLLNFEHEVLNPKTSWHYKYCLECHEHKLVSSNLQLYLHDIKCALEA